MGLAFGVFLVAGTKSRIHVTVADGIGVFILWEVLPMLVVGAIAAFFLLGGLALNRMHVRFTDNDLIFCDGLRKPISYSLNDIVSVENRHAGGVLISFGTHSKPIILPPVLAFQRSSFLLAVLWKKCHKGLVANGG